MAQRLGIKCRVPRPDAPLSLTEQRHEVGSGHQAVGAEAHLNVHRSVGGRLLQHVGDAADEEFRISVQ